MFRWQSIAVALFLSLAVSGCKQAPDHYLETFESRVEESTDLLILYEQAVLYGTGEDAKTTLADFDKHLSESKSTFLKKGAYQGDSILFSAALELTEFQLEYAQEHFEDLNEALSSSEYESSQALQLFDGYYDTDYYYGEAFQDARFTFYNRYVVEKPEQ